MECLRTRVKKNEIIKRTERQELSQRMKNVAHRFVKHNPFVSTSPITVSC